MSDQQVQLLIDLKRSAEHLVLSVGNRPSSSAIIGRQAVIDNIQKILEDRLLPKVDLLNLLSELSNFKQCLLRHDLDNESDGLNTLLKASNRERIGLWISDCLADGCLCQELNRVIANQSLGEYFDQNAILLNEETMKMVLLCIKAIEENKGYLLSKVNIRRCRSVTMPVLTPNAKMNMFDRGKNLSVVEMNVSDYGAEQCLCKDFADYSTGSSLSLQKCPSISSAAGSRKPSADIGDELLDNVIQMGRTDSVEDAHVVDETDTIRDLGLDDETTLQQSGAESQDDSLFEDVCGYDGTQLLSSSSHSQQTLRGFIAQQDFLTRCSAEQENAHMVMAELVIAAVEQMKSRSLLHGPQGQGMGESLRSEPAADLFLTSASSDSERSDPTVTMSMSVSDPSSISPSDDDLKVLDEQERRDEEASGKLEALEKMEIDESSLSADQVALLCLKNYPSAQLPKLNDLCWLVSAEEVPQQQMLPMPMTTTGEAAELAAAVRLRGDLQWAPPRRQIILTSQLQPRNAAAALTHQNYRCAGCGNHVDVKLVKRLRFCNYTGKLFCVACHQDRYAVIPGRIIEHWDFREYAVSDFAFNLLQSIYHEPVVNLWDLNKSLYSSSRTMRRLLPWRQRLFYVKNYILNCRFASDEQLVSQLQQLPAYWYQQLHVYSVTDIIKLKFHDQLAIIERVVRASEKHVVHCQLCCSNGCICELCRNGEDIIFAFQLDKVYICGTCNTCFHQKCVRAVPRTTKSPFQCPRCERARHRQLTVTVVESS